MPEHSIRIGNGDELGGNQSSCPLQTHKERPLPNRMLWAEPKAMIGMHDSWDSSQLRRPSPDNAGFRSMSVNDVWFETSENLADPLNGPYVVPSPTKTDAPCHLRNDMVFDVLNCRQFCKQQAAIPCNHHLLEAVRV